VRLRRRPPSPVPSEAFVFTHDGRRVDCLIEQLGPNEWQAVPVEDLTLEECARGWVDVVPIGGKVMFTLAGDE
jgi:hypothetical protein